MRLARNAHAFLSDDGRVVILWPRSIGAIAPRFCERDVSVNQQEPANKMQIPSDCIPRIS